MNDSGSTRRFDRESSDQPTRRLEDGDIRTPICPRCGGEMAHTRAWTTASLEYDRVGGLIRLAPGTSKPPLIIGAFETVSCAAWTCLECGYTEFYANELPRLKELIAEEDRKRDRRRK